MKIGYFSRVSLLAGCVFLMASGAVVAGFTSIYTFGDGVSTTTDGPGGGDYFGNSRCNGRVWVEVLSKWQGIDYDAVKNQSYFGHTSEELKTNTTALSAPADADTSLFVVWVNNADFVLLVTEQINPPFVSTTPWDNLTSQSIANHTEAVNTLYDKGARLILMPTAVDIMATPQFNFFDAGDKNFARARIAEFNTQFVAAMTALASSKQDLKIVLPDIFGFLDKVLANPEGFGMINPNPANSGLNDSLDPALDGAGAQYVFWDDLHPTAKFQMHLASFIQQTFMPLKVSDFSFSGGNIHLTVANIPLGREGVILGSATLQPGSWEADQSISEPSPGGSIIKTFVLPDDSPRRFYKVEFPVVWTWP